MNTDLNRRKKGVRGGRCAHFWLWAVLLIVGWPSLCAAADEENWAKYNGWEVTDFTVEGTPEHLAGELSPGLVFSGQWKLLKG